MWSKWITMKDVKELRFLGRPSNASQIEFLSLPMSLGCFLKPIPKFSNTLNHFWVTKPHFLLISNLDFAFLGFHALLLVQISSNFKTRLSCMLRLKLWSQNVPLLRLSKNRDSLHRGWFTVHFASNFYPSIWHAFRVDSCKKIKFVLTFNTNFHWFAPKTILSSFMVFLLSFMVGWLTSRINFPTLSYPICLLND